MLAFVQADDHHSSIDSIEQSSYLNESNQFDDFNQQLTHSEGDDSGFWLSPNSSGGELWCSPPTVVKQEQPATDYYVKQEQPFCESVVKAEPVSDYEAFAEDDECKQTSIKPLICSSYPVQQPDQLLNPSLISPPPVNVAFSQEPTQAYQPFVSAQIPPTFPEIRTTTTSATPISTTTCDPKVAAVEDDPTKIEKKNVVTRHRSYKRSKLIEGIAGSPPLPPDLELPAILGGKLPPRTFKTSSKKKHVFTERELRRRRKKGLPDDSDSESEERRLVRLPHRSLLTITTPQMSHFVAFMRTTVKLTPSQDDELCKQKRLVKNRECASRFRAKKELTLIEYRERVTELENDLEALRADNERLRLSLQQLQQQQQQQQPVLM